MQKNTDVHYRKKLKCATKRKNIVEIIYITKATTE